MKKTEKSTSFINAKMQTTIALRRQIIVTTSAPVKQFLDQWPALRMETEVFAEFQRITNQNLPNKFYSELDRHTPRLMTMYRQKASKTGQFADVLANILKVHDEQELHDIHTRRTTVIHALPVLLREDTSNFFRTCKLEDEAEFGDAPVALLTVVRDNIQDLIHYNPETISIIQESNGVTNLCRLADAFLVLFGLIYALHLSYLKGLTNTFEFVQKILLGLEDGKLSPRLETLKNDLFM
nr:uncharacterized protein LOC111838322 [Paramormyrops kingsleyae]